MRVLWLSINASLLNPEKTSGGWTSSLELALRETFGDELQLGVAFVTSEELPRRIVRDGTAYYPIQSHRETLTRLACHVDAYEVWQRLKPTYLQAIEDFEPDIIHCFGSEWPHAMIAEDASVPVVVHMQGFLNIYLPSIDMVIKDSDKRRYQLQMARGVKGRARGLVHFLTSSRWERSCADLERRAMRANHYFMGRTEWDSNVVRYYAPGARYFHVDEAMRPAIYEAAGSWRSGGTDRLRLLTISLGDYRKGNEIILCTAKLLKELVGIDFEWRVVGSKDFFPAFERRTGIAHEDVDVNLVGYLAQDGIVDELQQADLFIHPSIVDNSPNTVCEAQLIGCPVVASRVGGVPSLVEDGVTGFLYPYNEPSTLAFLIARLAGDESLLTQISHNEVEVARMRHDPSRIAHDLVRAYREIIDDYAEAHA